MGSHLLVGSGGETGQALAKKLSDQGATVFVTTHRRPLPDLPPSRFLPWDLEAPEQSLPDLDRALGQEPLLSLSLFAHPPFRRNSDSLKPGPDFPIASLIRLLDHLRPRLEPKTPVVFFFPSLSRHRADGYLAARLWIGALQGLFGELSRNRRGFLVTGIDTLITPDRTTPHITPEMVERIAGRTSRGRLATADEIADFAAWLICSRSPLFHGQILQTEGGPYF
ncbi:MAG: hypothetical protein M1537_00970 [Nitrospirae bacterium]|nr:hypothetical protein [Nitrospirota bacterium]MCL5284684.1 hypothetical protein [Nitrospirota bacterium]